MRFKLIPIFLILVSLSGYSISFKEYLSKGDSCLKYRKLDQAVTYYKLALSTKSEKLLIRPSQTSVYFQIALAYTELSDYQSALENLFKYVEKEGVKKNDSLLCDAYNSIGSNYDFLRKHSLALKFFKKSLTHAGNRPIQKGRAYNNLADTFQKLKQYKDAKAYYLKALKYFETSGVWNGKLVAYINLGTLEAHENKMKSAHQHFTKALNIAEEKNETYYIVIAKIYLAEFYIKSKNYNTAEDLLNWSLITAKDNNMPSYVNQTYKQYVDLYEQKKDFENAFHYLKLYKTSCDSIYNINSNREYAELEAKYSAREKEKENELLKTKQFLTESQVKSQKNYIHMLITIVIGGLILSLLFYYQKLKRSKANKLLEQKNKEISKAKKQLEDLNFQYEKLITKYEEKTINTLYTY